MKRYFLATGGILLLCNHSFSQIRTRQLNGADVNAITTAVPFLMISPDSKQGAMGDVGAATAPDVNSVFWNGSKLAFMDNQFGVGATVTPWLRRLVPDINMYYLSGYGKLNSRQVIGGSLRYFSLGSIELRDVTGTYTGNYNPNEFAVDLAFSQKLSQSFALGVATRFINSGISRMYVNGGSGNSASTFAADISAYYQSEKFKLGDKKAIATGGAAITNIGAKIRYSNDENFIPTNLRLGGGLKTDLDQYNTFSVFLDFNKLLVPSPPVYEYEKDSLGKPTTQIAIDPETGKRKIASGKDPNVALIKGMLQSFNDAPKGFKEELQEIIISTGVEYCYDNIFSVRAGYFHEAKNKGARQYFTMGMGFRFKVITVDGSYLIPTLLNNPLQSTWRISLSFNFDGVKKDEKKEPQP
ncbi:MAG: type IX secretion system outer membrane channel protein PorV [Bacteroidetes bacterium]|nr:type IX secretion system outer membrane channel protein PorV [Bacteroidota bacterium]